MTTDDEIRDEQLRYDINREAAKYQQYDKVKLIYMNFLQVKKFYHLIKVEL